MLLRPPTDRNTRLWASSTIRSYCSTKTFAIATTIATAWVMNTSFIIFNWIDYLMAWFKEIWLYSGIHAPEPVANQIRKTERCADQAVRGSLTVLDDKLFVPMAIVQGWHRMVSLMLIQVLADIGLKHATNRRTDWSDPQLTPAGTLIHPTWYYCSFHIILLNMCEQIIYGKVDLEPTLNFRSIFRFDSDVNTGSTVPKNNESPWNRSNDDKYASRIDY